MFTKILIANRGEIACRVAATAKRLGIRTVAVYSEADATAQHVAACDEALLIGPAPAKESYLRGDRIIAAALATGAQAIHPGYGFLSENEDFARACAEANLVFIGPPASAIRAMGSKSAAKRLMEKAGVPLVPGYHGERQEMPFLREQADVIGYPVLLKATAGGGGKGMRVVDSHAGFAEALDSCKREATAAFGDDRVLVEKYLIQPRHIEIQVFADSHGGCVHLFERDCSVQRRHQKVLEEAPAPGMTAERRSAMGNAAVAAARAVGYEGAGTVEFIVNQDGSFYFMEMNTRLQVEHPVTEMITSTDLVEWQLRVAAGEALPRGQAELTIVGHALEARIYAENPEKGFLPSIGTLRHLRTPPAIRFATPDSAPATGIVRIDSGVAQGDVISPFYDPMIAKLIVWAPDRASALALMLRSLQKYQVVGLSSNVGFLQRLVGSQPFSTANLDTGLIARHEGELFPAPGDVPFAVLALAVTAIVACEERTGPDTWSGRSGWRMNGSLVRTFIFDREERSDVVTLTIDRGTWTISDGARMEHVSLPATSDDGLVLVLGGATERGTVVRDGDIFHVWRGGSHTVLHYRDPMAHVGEAEVEVGRLTAPMPGKIVALMVSQHDVVSKGAPLLIMEAMKMEHTIHAPADGIVGEVPYAVGDQVADGAQLLVLRSATQQEAS